MSLTFCTIVLAAAAAVATVTGIASAQATQGTFYSQETLVFAEMDDVCTGLTGTVTDLVTDSGHFVTTDDAFHFFGLTLQVYGVDFSDGTYVLSSSPTHFEGGGNTRGHRSAARPWDALFRNRRRDRHRLGVHPDTPDLARYERQHSRHCCSSARYQRWQTGRSRPPSE